MRTVRVSRYTYLLSALGLAAALGVYGAVRVLLAQGNETVATAVSDIGGALVILLAAIVILNTARKFRPGDAVRLHWGLIGFGTLAYALGDMTWTYFEVFQGTDPFPSLADAFYVLTYVLLGAGIIMAALSYRRLMDVRLPAAIAGVVSLVLLYVLYMLLLKDTVADTELTALAKALSLWYPIGDVVLEFMPALLIVLVAWRLGKGGFGWPWWPLAAGVAILALSDSGFSLLDTKGLYEAGNPVDAGWMIGNVLIATGSLVARDVFGVAKASASAEKKAAA